VLYGPVSIFIIFLVVIIISFKSLKKELLYLTTNSLIKSNPPIVGKKINTLYSNYDIFLEGYFMVFFADANCSSCFPELEDLIDLNKKFGAVPVKVLVFGEQKSVHNFIRTYSKFFEIVEASPKDNLPADITLSFPSIALVNSQLYIERLFMTSREAYNVYKALSS